ncbi:MAG: sugar phosphate isomerase/epimerase, partial [Cyclobacteriaceae bacterium]|nr:sugar phosphate isomerase/epimerase [Cyclobacteriaceae bacterium]
MDTRRKFLKTAGAFAAGSIILPLGCTPGKKGETEANMGSEMVKEKKIGLQLYTLRNEINEQGLQAVLQRVSDIGYTWMEGFGYEGRNILGVSPANLKSMLSDMGMQMPSVHSVTEVSSEGGKEAIVDQMKVTAEDAIAVGAEYLVWAYLTEEDRQSLDDYKRHIETWNQFGEVCREAGIQFAYHNHDFEFMEFDGTRAYDLIIQETDPDLVKFELDLYWITKAGFDPVEYFNKARGRFPLWHVKDMEPGDEKFFA